MENYNMKKALPEQIKETLRLCKALAEQDWRMIK